MIQYYLRTILFFSLVMSSGSYAQKLTKFQDPQTKKYGFYNSEKRDTVYKANYLIKQEFLRIESNYERSVTIWVVSDGNKMGCLSDQGDWVIPLIYDQLGYHATFKVFIASLNNSIGMINIKDEVLIPFEYKSITPMLNAYWVNAENYSFISVQAKNDSIGVFNKWGIQILPCQFTSVNRLISKNYNYRSLEPVSSKSCLKVSKGENYGVYTLSGKEIIPVKYEQIEILGNTSSTEDSIQFVVREHNGTQKIITGHGTQFTFPETEIVDPLYNSEWEQQESQVKVVLVTDSLDRKKLVHLATGKTSVYCNEITVFGDYYYIRMDESYQLLDKELNVLTTLSNEEFLLGFIERNEIIDLERSDVYEVERLYSELYQHYRLRETPPLFVVEHEIVSTYKKKQKTVEYHYSLLNVSTGKETAARYKDFWRMGSHKAIYYWGFQASEKDPYGEMTVDVFDSAARYQRTVCIEKNEIESINDYRRGGGDTAHMVSYISINKAGLYGVRHINGRLLTPYILPYPPSYAYYFTDSTGYYWIGAYDQTQIVDFSGEVLFPKVQSGLRLVGGKYPDYFWMFESTGDFGRLIRSDLKVSYDFCKPFYYPILFDDTLIMKKRVGRNEVIIKDGYLCQVTADNIVPIDASYFKNDMEIRKFSYTTFSWEKTTRKTHTWEFWIDKTGKVLKHERVE